MTGGAILAALLLSGAPPALDARATMPAAEQSDPSTTARSIIERAHRAAGGETFTRPGTLFLKGYNIIRTPDGGEVLWDQYAMWRVFGETKADSRNANGRVRIEAWSDGQLALLLAFDGSVTSTQNGVMSDQSANEMWGNNFGFGAIRNALDEGWSQKRRPDRLIDGEPTAMVELTDPSGGKTLFGIRQSDDAIVYVGFQTDRGWHERRYSHFFEKPGVSWRQAGRVRLFYDGVKANEAVWTDFSIGAPLPDSLFRVERAPSEPTF
ncbi:MAG: hypothetical protein AAGH41_08540 [Pseudomonadota bacterium]